MSLRVVNLSKRFKDKWVLRDISFDVSQGEVLGVAGANGSGKTTLLRLINKDFESNGGQITSEPGATYWGPDGVDPGSFFARLFGKTSAYSRNSIQARLLDRIDNGQGVILLDEPFNSLDHHSRQQIENSIRTAAGRGRSIVVACSDFEHLMAVCDRAIVIAGTELKQTGSPRELYENPECRAVANVTGRCNLFVARRLSSSKAEIPEFHTIDGGHRLFARSVERGALGTINQNVTLGIRPEHISISFGASFPEDNLLRATITSVRFLGPSTLIDLDSGGLKLQALVLRLVGLNVGDECVLGLPTDKIHVFRD